MKKVEISCDACAKDIAMCESARDEYRLVLHAETIRNKYNIRYAIDMPPPIQREHQFCSLACLREWVGATKGELA